LGVVALSPDLRLAAALQQRITKNERRLSPWRQQTGVDAYRVYDADMPEWPAVIDVYGAIDGLRYAHAVWYAPAHGLTPTQRQLRCDALVQACAALSIPPERVVVKERTRFVGGEVHGDRPPLHADSRLPAEISVREGGAVFVVALVGQHDTGLFLDHRAARQWVAARAAGTQVLNLFCYTAAFTVLAGKAGAASSLSVDLSTRALAIAARNLSANGLATADHELEQGDVAEAMNRLRGIGRRFDLIVCDPPSFSKSRQARPFDVQRDHVELVSKALALLAPTGAMLFSTNRERFVVDDKLSKFEITSQTIGQDFRREPPPHRSFWLPRSAV
jgi:23S rRNA (guanine2445-N2)-methyltransferase / 23S rRNA (guanine2069-N7)-methyltransferase